MMAGLSLKATECPPSRWCVRSSVSALVGGLFLVQMSLVQVHLVSGLPHLALRHVHQHFFTMFVFATGMFIAALVLRERNFRLLKHDLEMTQMMLRINQELRADGALDKRLSRILQELSTLPQLALQQRAGVFLRSPKEMDWVLSMVQGEFPAEFHQNGPLLASVCDQVAASRQVLVSDRCIFDPRRQSCCKHTVHGNYIVPLVHQDRVEGVMFLYTDPAPSKDAHLLQLLEAIGATLGSQIAEERARAMAERVAARLNTMLESITDAFFTLDPDWCFTYINKEAERLLRKGRAELLGKVCWEAFEKTAGSTIDREYRRAVAEKCAVVFETFSPSLDRWLEIHAYPSEEGLAVYFRDVTERRQSQEQLKLMQTCIEQMNDMVFITGPQWADAQGPRILYVNKAFERHTGYSFEEIRDKTPQVLYGPSAPCTDFDQVRAALEQRNWSQRTERVYCTKSGEARWMEIESVPIADETGHVTHRVSVGRDITEYKKNEQQLRIAATAFEAQEGTIIADAENRILQVNRAFTVATGYTAEEAVGKKTDLLQSGRHDAAFYQAMWESIQRTGSWRGEIWNKRKNGEVYPERLTITAVKGESGEVTHYVGMYTDLAQQKAAAQVIQDLSFYDPLTHLPNRCLLMDRLQQTRETCLHDSCHGALLFLGLDNFKLLNNAIGYGMGDRVLQQIAQRLVTCVTASDTVACLGRDAFVVLLGPLSNDREEAAIQIKAVSEKVFAALGRPYALAGTARPVPTITANIGAVLFQDQKDDNDGLMGQADMAMHQAKAEGHNLLRFFDPETQAAVTARAEMEADLREGLLRKELVLHYQPMVDEEGRVTGAEALVRWQQPQRGLVYPGEFIPMAEETGQILPLGEWVLETACKQLVAWKAQPETAHLSLSVNVSAPQFRQPDFAERVLQTLIQTGAGPQRLVLEITESMLLGDMEKIAAKMKALKVRGVRFSLDDFGTGYSSLSYLKRLPLDLLKVDRFFVRDVLTDPHDRTIVRTILLLARSLGLGVVAEGVETQAQRELLFSRGCRIFQGYLFSRPLPIDQFEGFLRETLASEVTEVLA